MEFDQKMLFSSNLVKNFIKIWSFDKMDLVKFDKKLFYQKFLIKWPNIWRFCGTLVEWSSWNQLKWNNHWTKSWSVNWWKYSIWKNIFWYFEWVESRQIKCFIWHNFDILIILKWNIENSWKWIQSISWNWVKLIFHWILNTFWMFFLKSIEIERILNNHWSFSWIVNWLCFLIIWMKYFLHNNWMSSNSKETMWYI